MTFTVPARRAEILSGHVAPIAGYLNGATGDDYVHNTNRFGSHATLYADQVTQGGAGGVFRAGYGTSGNQTWMIDATQTTTTIRGLLERGPSHDIKAYGAPTDAALAGGVGPWGGTDASTAVQAAITAAGSGGTVYVPKGVYVIDNPIKIHNLDEGLTIIGSNAAFSRFVAGPNMAGKPIFEVLGTASLKVKNIGVGDTQNASVALAGFLIANSTTRTASANVYDFENVSVSGDWSGAALAIAALVSSRFRSCQFDNHNDGKPAIFLSSTNSQSWASSTVGVVLSATGGVGELGFFGCEVHDIGVASGASAGPAIICEATYGLSFFGGNLGGNGPRIVEYRGANTDQVFNGVQLYAQDPSGTTPTNTFWIASSGSVTGMTVHGCRLDAATAQFGGASGTSYNRLNATSNTINGGASSLVAFTTAGTLADPDIDCLGLNVNCGTGTITRGILRNPNSVTANTDSSTRLRSDGSWVYMGGNLSIGATTAGAGAVRIEMNTGVRARNADNTADVILAATNNANDVSYGQSSSGTLGAITIGQTSSSGVVTINSTSGVSLTYGSTTRVATTSTGAAVTGVVTATAAALGTTPATAGDVRLPSSGTVQFRNSVDNNNIIAVTKDGSDNLTYGNASLASSVTLVAANNTYLLQGANTRIQANSTGLGFNGATPIARPDYTITNPSTDRALNVSGDTTAQVAAVLGTLIQDLIDYGLLQ